MNKGPNLFFCPVKNTFGAIQRKSYFDRFILIPSLEIPAENYQKVIEQLLIKMPMCDKMECKCLI
jgi:hypothetical protein